MNIENAIRASKPVKRVVLLIGILLMPGLFIVGPVSASITGVQPSQYGDWDITTPTIARNEIITLAGNLIVRTTLTLENTTIKFNCGYNGQYGIDVLSGGHLNVMDFNGDSSNITSTNQFAYTFRIRQGSFATLMNSEIHKCGYYPGSIDYRSGLGIETDDVTISGCAITNNYVGIYLGAGVDIDITASRTSRITNYTSIEENTYGIYAKESAAADVYNALITRNSQYNMYLDSASMIGLYDCHPIDIGTIGGPGQFQVFDPDDTYNAEDHCEIDYNSDGQTLRYDTWSQSGANHYANSQCVLRRGYDYEILENDCQWVECHYNHGVNEHTIGYTIDIEYPITPSDSTDLIIYSDGKRYISIPSDYPIVYCTVQFKHLWSGGGSDVAQEINVCIILDLPATTGSDAKTGLTAEARAEYSYIDDDGNYNNLPNNIDLRGQYYRYGTSGWTYYDYGGSSTGLDYTDFDFVRCACLSGYNMVTDIDAADHIKDFVSYLVHGDWKYASSDMAWDYSVEHHLDHVSDAMATYPSQQIALTHPQSAAANDALGLHCHADPDGFYDQNEHRYQCHDFAAISTGLDRSIGIPARQVAGKDYHVGSHTWDYHVWTEAWIRDNDIDANYDNKWIVHDACGCDWINGYTEDVDPSGSAHATRTDYIANLDTDFGHPQYVYTFFRTTDMEEESQYCLVLTNEYGVQHG